MTGPLADLRVIELGALGPAPFAAMVLADLGARVLRIRRPDPQRLVPDEDRPELSDDEGRNPWDVLNRNRSSVGVDLRNPEGVALVRRLAEGADVLVEGFRPGVAERFGLGPAELHATNQRLVIGRMTGWGQDGPLAPRVGHDLDYLALSGVLAHVGRADQPPTPPLNLVADFGGGGMLLAVGVLAAVVERSSSGRGQVVDAAMVDGAALLMAPLFGAWASGYWSAERGTNLLDSGAPFYDCYPCADGRWLAIGAIETPFFAELLAGLGLDPGVLPDQHDRPRWPELRTAIADAVRTRTRDEWAEVFADRDACVAPVLDMGEAPSHPHAVARASFVTVDGVAQPAPAPRFDRTPAGPVEPSKETEDPAAVLGRWGVAAEEVAELRAAGVVG
ncbi:MAG: CaiB/BaiF CoA transferase family protein [Microthrixaceae bacterium]